MNSALHISKKRECKCCSFIWRASHGDGTVLSFDNRFCKRKSQTDSLGIKGMAAPVKTFENVMDIFRGDSASVVRNEDPKHSGRTLPYDSDDSAGAGVIQRILYEVAQRLGGPFHIAGEAQRRIPGYYDLLLFQVRPCCKIDDCRFGQTFYSTEFFMKDDASCIKT